MTYIRAWRLLLFFFSHRCRRIRYREVRSLNLYARFRGFSSLNQTRRFLFPKVLVFPARTANKWIPQSDSSKQAKFAHSAPGVLANIVKFNFLNNSATCLRWLFQSAEINGTYFLIPTAPYLKTDWYPTITVGKTKSIPSSFKRPSSVRRRYAAAGPIESAPNHPVFA